MKPSNSIISPPPTPRVFTFLTSNLTTGIRWTIIFIAASVLFLSSCRKDEEQLATPERIVSQVEKDFFTKGFIEERNPYVIKQNEVSVRSPGVLDSVYNELKRENEEHNFIPHFVELFGFPSWQNAFIMEDSNKTEAQVAIPFFHEYDTLITGFLYSRVIDGRVELGDFFIYNETAEIIADRPQPSTWELNSIRLVLSSILNEEIFDNLHFSDEYHKWILEAIDTYQLTNENNPAVYSRSGFVWCFWTCLAWTSGQGQSAGTGWYWIDKHLASGSPVPVNINNHCIQWAYICVQWDLEPPDWDRFHDMNPQGGGSTSGSPTINLEPHLDRMEKCGGLGEPYDYGPSNPSGQHPDWVFCEQLQSLYDCLPFLASDKDLIAWYLGYDETYPGDTWTSLYNFGCGSHMSPALKEEGIRLFRKLVSPGGAYPPYNNNWEVFLDRWALVASLIEQGLVLTADEKEWLSLNPNDLIELNTLVALYKPYTEEFLHIQQATSIFLKKSLNPIIISEEQAYESVVGSSPPGWAWALAIRAEYLSLKLEHCLHTYNPGTGIVTFSNCEWSESRLKWTARLNVLAEGFHITLDLAGFVPGVGEIADLTNGIIYSIEGDGFNASLSFAAMLPIAGWTSTSVKFATRTITGPSGRTITFKYLRETANSLITFGDPRQLRRVLGLAKGNPLVAHHLIPWSKSSHEIVQKAANSADVTLSNGTVLKPWHMNDALNGIPLDYTVHTGNHTTYSNKVVTWLNQFDPDDLLNEDALKKMHELTAHIRVWIANNPTVHIDNIILP